MIVPGLGETSLRRVIQTVLELAAGGTNALSAAPVTLAPGVNRTEVRDARCGPQTLPVLVPLSAGAAAAELFIAEVRAGSFVIGHSVSASAERTVAYELRRP